MHMNTREPQSCGRVIAEIVGGFYHVFDETKRIAMIEVASWSKLSPQQRKEVREELEHWVGEEEPEQEEQQEQG